MVARIQWSRERPCVYRRPPLNHEGTYPDKLTNAENVLPRLQRYTHHLSLQPTRTDVFRSVNNDGTLLSRRNNVVVSTLHSTRRRGTNSDMWKKDRRPHHAIKITNQKSVRVQNESRLFYHRRQRYFDAVITPYIYISA